MSLLRIDLTGLRGIGMEVLQQLRVSEWKAGICLDAFLFGSLRGLETHGFFALLPRMVTEIRAGRILPEKDMTVSRRNPSSLFVDGGWGPGPVTAFNTMGEAIRLAQEGGSGASAPAVAIILGQPRSMVSRL